MDKRVLSIAEFCSRFTEMAEGSVVRVDIGGKIPMMVKVSPKPGASALVVLFHGAIQRTKRKIPSFMPFRSGVTGQMAHQLSVADPTLHLHPRLSLAWYAGAPGLLLQNLLPPFFRSLHDALQVERTVFMGSSGGGFAALNYSWHLPGSLAVVQVPQTNAYTYHRAGAMERYRELWRRPLEQQQDAPVLDLSKKYSVKVPGAIVYIQSNLDIPHLHGQMLPFLRCMPAEFRHRIVVKASYWGRTGHSNVVPVEEWDAWVQASILSRDATIDSIVQQYAHIGVERVGQFHSQSNSAAGLARPDNHSMRTIDSEEDQEWARVIVKELLGTDRGASR